MRVEEALLIRAHAPTPIHMAWKHARHVMSGRRPVVVEVDDAAAAAHQRSLQAIAYTQEKARQ